MDKYTKIVTNTYFRKSNPVSIEKVKPGDLVYLSVRSPHHYGNKFWQYWGKIKEVTPQFFDIIQYFEASFSGSDHWETDSIKRMDNIPVYCKRWAKKSIIELCYAETTEKTEEVTFYSHST